MLMTKIDPPEPILLGWAERDRVAPEGFADAKNASAIRDVALGLHLPDDIRGAILNGRQGLGEGVGTGVIARRRDRHGQRFMGAVQVLEGPPPIKVLLAVRQVLKLPPVKQFRFEGAMKAFVFAQGLRMSGPGMADRDPEADAPDGQGRESSGRPTPDGWRGLGESRVPGPPRCAGASAGGAATEPATPARPQRHSGLAIYTRFWG